jgi:hypothetical protein
MRTLTHFFVAFASTLFGTAAAACSERRQQPVS